MRRGLILEKATNSEYVVLVDGQFCRVKLKGNFMPGDEIELKNNTWSFFTLKLKAVAVLAFLLLFVTPALLSYAKEREVVAYLTIGGEKGVKIGLNRKEKVVKVVPLSAESQKYLKELKGLPAEEAIKKATSVLQENKDMELEIIPGKKINVTKYKELIKKYKAQKIVPSLTKERQENSKRQTFQERTKNDKINKNITKNPKGKFSGGGGNSGEKLNPKSNNNNNLNHDAFSIPAAKSSGRTTKSKGSVKGPNFDRGAKNKINR